MGKVIVPARVVNFTDLAMVKRGLLAADQVRTVEVPDALVDTGATLLSLPKRFIAQLGLDRVRVRTAKTPGGIFEFGIYEPVQLTVQGRECRIEVAELPDNCPVLIGQIPLEMMDWVVDPVGQRLIGNPEHNGEDMFELFGLELPGSDRTE